MKDKNKIIITVCLSGIIILLLALLILRILEAQPRNYEQSQMEFSYHHLVNQYKEDKEKSQVTDGKYSSVSLFKDGKELKILGEFDITNGNLIHICISDGTKKLDVKDTNITKKYLEENAEFVRSTETCEFSE